MSEPESAPQRSRTRATLGWIGLGVVCVVVAAGLWYYFRQERLYPSTDDAYVRADVVRIAPRIDGAVISVPVTSYARVALGDLLLKIDPAPYQADVDAATAALTAAEQQAGALGAGVTSAQATVRERQAAYNNAEKQAARINELVARKDLSQAEADKANATRDQALAAWNAAKADLERAIAELGQSGKQNAQVRQALAALEKAQLHLSYTDIKAPADGQIGDVSIKPGAYVQTGQSLFPLVKSRTWYVSANFKETQLERLKTGEPVTVAIDMYPGRTWKGEVETLSPASGAAFALLPPENASGNWVKVTQRFPVRVKIENDKPDAPLRVGASATVTVDTTGKTALSNGTLRVDPEGADGE